MAKPPKYEEFSDEGTSSGSISSDEGPGSGAEGDQEVEEEDQEELEAVARTGSSDDDEAREDDDQATEDDEAVGDEVKFWSDSCIFLTLGGLWGVLGFEVAQLVDSLHVDSCSFTGFFYTFF